MIGVEINAHFARRGGDHECGFIGRMIAGEKAQALQLLLGVLPFLHSPRANEKLHVLGWNLCRFHPLFDSLFRLLRHVAAVAVDENSDRHLSLVGERPGCFGQPVFEPLVIKRLEHQAFFSIQPCLDHRVFPVLLGKTKNIAAPVAPGGGKRQQTEARDQVTILCLLRAKSVIFIAIPSDPLQQALERRHKMRFVEHQQRIRAEQSRVIGPHPAAHPVALEQQARANHVHRADDDRGRRRVFEPLPVIRVPAAQGADPQRAIVRSLLDALGNRRGLIDHGTPVNHIDQPARHGRTGLPGQIKTRCRS